MTAPASPDWASDKAKELMDRYYGAPRDLMLEAAAIYLREAFEAGRREGLEEAALVADQERTDQIKWKDAYAKSGDPEVTDLVKECWGGAKAATDIAFLIRDALERAGGRDS